MTIREIEELFGETNIIRILRSIVGLGGLVMNGRQKVHWFGQMMETRLKKAKKTTLDRIAEE